VPVEGCLAPVELKGIDRRQMHHGQVHVTAFVQEFRSCGFEEPTARKLRQAVGPLQRNPDEGQGGADVDDVASIPGAHTGERGLCSPD
jgi:hypothetical protein